MINTKRVSILLLVLFSAIMTQAQSLTDIVNKNVASLGGADKLKDLKTQYAEGTMEVQGMSLPFKKWVVQGKALRMEFTVMGTTNVQVVNGAEAWVQMPVMGKPDPETMDSSTTKLMASQLDLTGDFYRYNEKGNKLELQGLENINGAKLAKVKVISHAGITTYCYVDPATGNVLKTLNKIDIQGQSMDLTTDISNFLKTADGFTYGSVISQDPTGVKITVSKLENNVPVDESIFKKP
jgi:hypothetical protein